jgi:hypothetical protein
MGRKEEEEREKREIKGGDRGKRRSLMPPLPQQLNTPWVVNYAHENFHIYQLSLCYRVTSAPIVNNIINIIETR